MDDKKVSQILWVQRTTCAECKTIRIAVSTVKDNWVVLLKLRLVFPHKPKVCVCGVIKVLYDNHNNMIKFDDLAYRVNPDGLALIKTLRL